MKDEWWLSAAISDDRLVADLLLRLKDSSSSTTTTTTTSQCSTHLYMTSLPLTWGLRHPRSSLNKKRYAPRRSPTTPLSYGCLASPTHGGCDYSSANLDAPSHLSHGLRSKISTSSGTLSTLTKRCKRKKTFAELKEEVSSLMKEQTYLKKELATMHGSVKEQRSMNTSLKRIKLDLHQESEAKPEVNSTEPEEQTTSQSGGASSEVGSTSLLRHHTSEPDSGPANKGVVTSQQQSGFVLPDLNMMPDENCSDDNIVGIMS